MRNSFRGGRKVRRLALAPGSHDISVISKETQVMETLEVELEAEEELVVP
ncbi:MAG: hypothetical protein GY811_13205 [Myxococcales bacterium]|nr:hypothetical protein [Myxococcales bacterium]